MAKRRNEKELAKLRHQLITSLELPHIKARHVGSW